MDQKPAQVPLQTPHQPPSPGQSSAPPKQSAWEKAKHGGKATFDKAWAGFEKLGAPVNKLTNKIGSEAFWPTTLDHESNKAARILKSFCKDGFYKEQPAAAPAPGDPKTQTGPRGKPKVLVKIPQKVIQNAVGLAIFTVMRTGLWVSGAGGSGVLIARKEDGSWGPPSGILIHTLGVGFMAGIDIYDCVVVINSKKALEAFSKVRVSLGGEMSVVAGPLGVGGVLDSEILKDRKPLFSYMKSRGLYGGLQLDGTIIVERNDENARFYGERLPIDQVLAGNVRKIPQETRMLAEVVKSAEGRQDVDEQIMQQAAAVPPPGDFAGGVEKTSEPTADQIYNYGPPPNSAVHPSHPNYAAPPTYDTQQTDAYPTPLFSNPAGPSEYPPEKVPDPIQRTDSGFAAPPPQPPRPGTNHTTTDLGFVVPPRGPPSQGKQDPDGPPRYA